MKVMLMVLGPNLMFFNMMNGQNCLSPGSPTTGLITPSTAEMNWNSIPGADGYELEYRVLNAPATVPWNNVTVAANTTTLTGLTANTVYLAQVRTICGGNFSDYTGKVVFSTAACIPASGLAAGNITQTTADLNWTPANGASGYKLLWRKLNSTQAPDPWNSDITGNSTLGITGLTESSLYETRILTDCGGTWSDTSNSVFFSTAGCSVPANLVVTGMNAGSITLQWSTVPGATQYNIDYREIGTFTWNTVNSNTNDKMIHGLTDNTQYELRVRSRCGGNNFSDYTLPINGYTLPCGMPVNALVTAVSVDRATINWNNATGANNYRVDYRETGSPTWNTVTANNTTKKLNNLTPDTEYQVRIRSKCSGNQYSAYADTISFNTHLCNPPLTINIDILNKHKAFVSWSPVIGIQQYQIEFKQLSDSLWTTLNTNNSSKTLNGLNPCFMYQVRVRSKCSVNLFSSPSPILNFSTIPLLNINDSLNHVSCYGLSNGSIYPTVTGGKQPLTYLWSNGATTEILQNLINGNYILTVTDDNGCIRSVSYQITQPSQLSVTYNIDNLHCGFENGSILINTSGGKEPYTYLWSSEQFAEEHEDSTNIFEHQHSSIQEKNLTQLAEGTYNLLIIDANGCTLNIDSLKVEVDLLPQANAGQDQTIRLGESVQLNGAGGIDYHWSPDYYFANSNISQVSATPTVTTTFTLTIIDHNNCESYDTVTINVIPSTFSAEKLNYIQNQRDCCFER